MSACQRLGASNVEEAIQAVVLVLARRSGSVDGRSLSSPAPTLSGTSEAGAVITIFDGGSAIDSPTANKLGAWC